MYTQPIIPWIGGKRRLADPMARLLGEIKGKAIINLNDHPDIRRVFTGYHIETTDIKYTVGGGKGS